MDLGNFILSLRNSFTLPKILAGISSAIILALARYGYYGNLDIDFSNVFGNISWGIIAFIIRSVFISIFDNFDLKLPMGGYKDIKPKSIGIPKNTSLHMDNSGSTGNSGSADNSGPADNSGSSVTDIDYHQRELILAKEAKKALEKDPSSWTPDEKEAALAYIEIDEFNKDSIDDYIKSHTKSLKDAIKSSKPVYNENSSTSRKRGADYTPEEGYVNKYIRGEGSNDNK